MVHNSGHPRKAVLDACVLYPAPIRDLLLRLAAQGFFEPVWSVTIHDEWVRNLLSNRPDLSQESLERTIELMNQAFPEAQIEGYMHLISTLTLPDPDDRHVLALAIQSEAHCVVTFNLRDFPVSIMEEYNIILKDPDTFLSGIISENPSLALQALEKQVAALSRPQMSIQQVLEILRQLELPNTVYLFEYHLQ